MVEPCIPKTRCQMSSSLKVLSEKLTYPLVIKHGNGKTIIYRWFSHLNTICRVFFSIATFDYRRVYRNNQIADMRRVHAETSQPQPGAVGSWLHPCFKSDMSWQSSLAWSSTTHAHTWYYSRHITDMHQKLFVAGFGTCSVHPTVNLFSSLLSEELSLSGCTANPSSINFPNIH